MAIELCSLQLTRTYFKGILYHTRVHTGTLQRSTYYPYAIEAYHNRPLNPVPFIWIPHILETYHRSLWNSKSTLKKL